MPVYLIHRLRENVRQQFRWAPHTLGDALVKPKDYERSDSVQAETPYAAWMALRDTPDALGLGDILESESGGLCIYKYVGFENAQWQVPESKPAGETHEGPDAVGSSPAWKA